MQVTTYEQNLRDAELEFQQHKSTMERARLDMESAKKREEMYRAALVERTREIRNLEVYVERLEREKKERVEPKSQKREREMVLYSDEDPASLDRRIREVEDRIYQLDWRTRNFAKYVRYTGPREPGDDHDMLAQARRELEVLKARRGRINVCIGCRTFHSNAGRSFCDQECQHKFLTDKMNKK